MTEKTAPKIYVRNYCGYCYKVVHAIKTMKLEIDIKNIWVDANSKTDLVNATGSSRVPVLRYTNELGQDIWLPESDDIINYLSERQFDKEALR